jgi:hypothetical protein
VQVIWNPQGTGSPALAEALYSAHPSKPFSIPEWAPWGIDDPAYVARIATFVKTHGRTILLSYDSGTPGSVFDLATKPKSRSVYRGQIVPLGR